jgi:deferrochelatase/peroxidase EfeB
MNNNFNDANAGPVPKLSDIQGLILRGYNLPYVRYIIFTIKDVEGAREFCKKILPGSNEPLTVTTATPWQNGQKPAYCLNVGFTVFGLKKFITETQYKAVANKSYELFQLFKNGAAYPDNADLVGDTDDSAPALWWKRSDGWQSPTNPAKDGSDLDVQVSLFAHDHDSLELHYQTLLSMIPANANGSSMLPVFMKDSEPLPQGDDFIHFGYKDSFSQPRLSKVPWNTTQGRLLLGKSTVDDRPIVPPYHFVISPRSPSGPTYNSHPLLQNGTFAAFRLLYQDVKAFNKFINNPKNGASPDLVAAKMCGRWFDGTPLVISPEKPDPNLKDFDFTNFNYINPTENQQGVRQNDDLAQLCPYASHIRRTNPRDDGKVKGNTNPDGTAANAQAKRIMRRAGPYGPEYTEKEPAGIQRGLVGLFICANLTEQFLFIMQSWINMNNFRPGADNSPNLSGFDPLFGPPKSTIPQFNEFDYLPDGATDQPYKRITGIERFIRTDGSLFLFLPGIAGLENLANGILPALH